MATDLDRFKRRLVRSTARLILQEQRPEEEVWVELRKETGCDCKLLWDRMRALTIKKLNRLLAVEDQMDKIAGVARMSITDWLLFDLVLVHEKIDFISKDEPYKPNKAMLDLFELVREYEVELINLQLDDESRPTTVEASIDKLVDAWRNITKAYNRTQGRQSSPMLLQRRWYQLKEATRGNFYTLWQSYRGNQRLWDQASGKPNELQSYVAKRFPHVITQAFPEWSELVQKGRVIMPEQFELRRRGSQPQPKDDKPDLVMIEPVVETIDVASDDDNPTADDNSENENSAFKMVTIKQEPEEIDGLSNVKILASTHITEESIEKLIEEVQASINDQVLDSAELKHYGSESMVPELPSTSVKSDICSSLLRQHLGYAPIVTENPSAVTPDDLIRQKADEFVLKKQLLLEHDTSLPETALLNEVDNVTNDIIKQKADEFFNKDREGADDLVNSNLGIAENALEFVDDGIEYEEEDEDSDINNEPKINDLEIEEKPLIAVKSEKDDCEDNDKGQPEESEIGEFEESENGESDEHEKPEKFDLKLIMHPVVYTLKLDDMATFKGKPFDSANDTNVITAALLESRPVSKLTVKIEANTDEIDQPKLGQADSSFDSSSDDEISDDKKVKVTSYLLQKPRSRSYNPIQLCKNPDFNTRLKRLNTGFFCSVRNRQLLNACMPVTIDLHKAFEQKLVDGTLYLKPWKGDIIQPDNDTETQQTSTVMPSAMPVQSLFSNDKTKLSLALPSTAPYLPTPFTPLPSTPSFDTVDLTKKTADEEIAERNKIINLRDLSEIRRINKTLLTAEVSPIRVDKGELSIPMVQIPSEELSLGADEQLVASKTDEEEFAADELQIVGISGGQETTIPPHDLSEDKSLLHSYPIEKQSLLIPMHGRGGRGRGRGRGSRGGFTEGRKILAADKPKPKPARKVDVPWNKPKVNTPSNLDEFLITQDTLNRMISKLIVSEGFIYNPNEHKKGKGKLDIWNTAVPEKGPTVDNEVEVETDEGKTNNTAGNAKNIAAKNNENAVDKITDDNGLILPWPKKRRVRTSASLFCCWSSEKLAKMRAKEPIARRHTCKGKCGCCCSHLLELEVKEMGAKVHFRKTKWGIRPVITCATSSILPIIISDEDNEEAKTNNVPMPKLRIVTPGTPPVPATQNVMLVRAAKDGNVEGDTEKSNLQQYIHNFHSKTASDVRGVKMINTTVTTTSNSPTENIASNLKINISFVPTEPSTSGTQEPFITTRNFPKEFQSVDLSPLLDRMGRKLPVLCPKPTIDTATRKIVIDGSLDKSLEIKIPNTIQKDTFVGCKKPKECPIFLGKNKILLTTVKFPPNLNNDEPEKSPQQQVSHAKVIPALPLPDGVQLVLLPDGELTYTVDPAVTVNEEQLSVMPSIIATVREQMNLSKSEIANRSQNILLNHIETTEKTINAGAPTVIGEVIDLETEKDTPGDEAGTENVSKTQNVSNCSEADHEEAVANQNEENTDSLTQTPANNIESQTEIVNTEESSSNLNNTNAKNSSSETVAESAEDVTTSNIEKSEANKSETEVNEPKDTCRNLLSDLMEMSGISAEDTTLAPQTIDTTLAPVAASLDVPKDATKTELSPQSSNLLLSHQILTNFPELTPVVSLPELKYACAHNGLFFKLDFETGILVQINVCIKKNTKKKVQPAGKSVIDLTDEGDSPDYDPSKPFTLDYDNVIKPVKLFRSVPVISNLLKRKRRTPQISANKDTTTQPQTKHIRKQSFNKIEAKIDLIDSDEPMEEEYLVDSSDSDAKSSTKRSKTSGIAAQADKNVILVPAKKVEDSDDSSDEEPLSVKFSRLKQYENKLKTIENKDNNPSELEQVTPENATQGEHDGTPTKETQVVNEGKQNQSAESGEGEGPENMETDPPEILTFFAEGEGEQEDCILGF